MYYAERTQNLNKKNSQIPVVWGALFSAWTVWAAPCWDERLCPAWACDQSTSLRVKLHGKLTRDKQLSVCAGDEQSTDELGLNKTAPGLLQHWKKKKKTQGTFLVANKCRGLLTLPVVTGIMSLQKMWCFCLSKQEIAPKSSSLLLLDWFLCFWGLLGESSKNT